MADLTRDEILAMEAGPELDALVAPIMGLTSRTAAGKLGTSTLWYTDSGECVGRCPGYSTDIAADYEVLVHVREIFTFEQRLKMRAFLDAIWLERKHAGKKDMGWPLMYQPGDHSRAALLTTLPAKDGQGDDES